MSRKKILLLTPPYHCGVVESAGRWPSLALLYLAGELRKAGFEPIYYDAMSRFHTLEKILSEVESIKPDVVAVTTITATYPAAQSVLAGVKALDPNIVTVAGGVHASFSYHEILTQTTAVDYCVIEEGEVTLPELLLAHFAGGDVAVVRGVAFRRGEEVVATPRRPFIQDLDVLTPAWDLIDFREYPLYFIEDSRVAIVSSSRGCVYECAFCSQRQFWQGTYRQRSPEAFVAEIEYLVKHKAVNAFFIADEYPTYSRERWVKILDLLIEKDLGINILMETCVVDIVRDADILDKYRKAGVMFIYMGVEAMGQDRLDAYNKNVKIEQSRDALRLVKEAGMISESSLILGMPDETPETIQRTLDLAKTYGAHYMHFLFITPWPYVGLWHTLKDHIEEYDYAKYNLVHPIVKPNAMSRDELFKQVLRCYREYYSSKISDWYNLPKTDFRRRCLLMGLKAIFENSFLRAHMGSMHEMPQQLKGVIHKIFAEF